MKRPHGVDVDSEARSVSSRETPIINTSTTPGSIRAEQPEERGGARPYRLLALAAGDLIVFFLFAFAGRGQHGETQGFADVLATAFPFATGFFAVAPLLGAYGLGAAGTSLRPRRLLISTALAWVVAWALGLFARAAIEGHTNDGAFPLVALIIPGVLLLGWRGVASLLFWRR